MRPNELQHDWTAKPRRLRGTLSIRPPKPDGNKPAGPDETGGASV
jgi:hypothetical protein